VVNDDAGTATGHVIRTLTPVPVAEILTSSARPEITAKPNPAGNDAPAAAG
jgi:hypothetical protein